MEINLGPPVKKDEEYNVKIEVMGDKGDGIAKIQNYTIFVPGTKEGDQVKIRIKSVLPKFAFAEIILEEKEKEEQKAEAQEQPANEEAKETQKEDTEDFGEDKKEEETSKTNPD